MGLYRTKPQHVEAFQFRDLSNTDPSVPAWFVDEVLGGSVQAFYDHVVVKTGGQSLFVEPGDWIIRDHRLQLAVCGDTTFANHFEPADSATAISLNQIITEPMTPGDNSVLELVDQAGDTFGYIGAPVVIAPYKPPKDKRVQQVLKDAAAARAAEDAPARAVFSDPRLDPKYKPSKK